jgi:hypothetical protein
MHNYYDDIIERLGDPTWWDEVGCPRYCKFLPNKINDIYAKEAVLLLISCQSCECEFKVAMSIGPFDSLLGGITSLKKEILEKTIHYGDPPNINCCAAGPTMNCNDIKIIEYWERDNFSWERKHDLEISLIQENENGD